MCTYLKSNLKASYFPLEDQNPHLIKKKNKSILYSLCLILHQLKVDLHQIPDAHLLLRSSCQFRILKRQSNTERSNFILDRLPAALKLPPLNSPIISLKIPFLISFLYSLLQASSRFD